MASFVGMCGGDSYGQVQGIPPSSQLSFHSPQMSRSHDVIFGGVIHPL